MAKVAQIMAKVRTLLARPTTIEPPLNLHRKRCTTQKRSQKAASTRAWHHHPARLPYSYLKAGGVVGGVEGQ